MLDTSETKHTPGPWTIEEYGDDETPTLVIHKDSESRVCFMATPGSHGDPAKIEADAHLIAAAPAMLEALKRAAAASALLCDAGHKVSCDCVGAAVREAIAKATGTHR